MHSRDFIPLFDSRRALEYLSLTSLAGISKMAARTARGSSRGASLLLGVLLLLCGGAQSTTAVPRKRALAKMRRDANATERGARARGLVCTRGAVGSG